MSTKPEIKGPLVLIEGETVNYQITNFDSSENYEFKTEQGFITSSNDSFTYYAPQLTGEFQLEVNNTKFKVKILSKDTRPEKASIIFPEQPKEDFLDSITFFADRWKSLHPNDSFDSIEWDFSSDIDFDTDIPSSVEVIREGLSLSFLSIPEETYIFTRCRMRGKLGLVGEWSEVLYYYRKSGVKVFKPLIASPGLDSVVRIKELFFNSSPFISLKEGETISHAIWEFSQHEDFSHIVFSNTTIDENALVCGVKLPKDEIILVRVKHFGSLGTESEWSDPRAVLYKDKEEINQPLIMNPSSAVITQESSITLRSSIFSTSEVEDKIAYSHWQLSTDPTFEKDVVEKTVDKDSFYTYCTFQNLQIGVVCYARMRFKSMKGWFSDWSPNLKILKVFVQPPTVIFVGTDNLRAELEPLVKVKPMKTSGLKLEHLGTDWVIVDENDEEIEFSTGPEVYTFKLPPLEPGKKYQLKGKHKSTVGFSSPMWGTYSFKTRDETLEFLNTASVKLKETNVRGISISHDGSLVVARNQLFSQEKFGLIPLHTFTVPAVHKDVEEVQSALTLANNSKQITQFFTYKVKGEDVYCVGYSNYSVFEGKVFQTQLVIQRNVPLKAKSPDTDRFETWTGFQIEGFNGNSTDELIVYHKTDKGKKHPIVVKVELEFLEIKEETQKFKEKTLAYKGFLESRYPVLRLKQLLNTTFKKDLRETLTGSFVIKENEELLYTVSKHVEQFRVKEIPILDKNLGLTNRQDPIFISEHQFSSNHSVFVCIRDNHLLLFRTT